MGVNRSGAFAKDLVIPATNVVKCEHGIGEELCSSFDPLGNAVHTALTFNLVGEDVLITDVNDYRLNLVKEICDEYVYPVNVAKEDIKEVMNHLGICEGFDIGLEMSGNGSAFNMMLDNLYNGGRCKKQSI